MEQAPLKSSKVSHKIQKIVWSTPQSLKINFDARLKRFFCIKIYNGVECF